MLENAVTQVNVQESIRKDPRIKLLTVAGLEGEGGRGDGTDWGDG